MANSKRKNKPQWYMFQEKHPQLVPSGRTLKYTYYMGILRKNFIFAFQNYHGTGSLCFCGLRKLLQTSKWLIVNKIYEKETIIAHTQLLPNSTVPTPSTSGAPNRLAVDHWGAGDAPLANGGASSPFLAPLWELRCPFLHEVRRASRPRRPHHRSHCRPQKAPMSQPCATSSDPEKLNPTTASLKEREQKSELDVYSWNIEGDTLLLISFQSWLS